MKLHIDIETFCDLDLQSRPGKPGVGVYKYAQHPSFKIILFAYRWNDGPVNVIDCHNDEYPGESIPPDVWRAMTEDRDDVQIWAHNANFEYVCISTYYKIKLHPHRWYCTMVAAAYLGLPLGLDSVGKVLHLTEQKDAKGKALINFFCMPNKSRKKSDNGAIIINTPEDHPEKWELFKEYNAQDVRVECEIENYVAKFPAIPQFERDYWLQDQHINSVGITVDRNFISAAIQTNAAQLAAIHQEIKDCTGVSNPDSLPQLKAWFKAQDCPITSLNKEYLAEAIKEELLPEHILHVLKLRQLGSRTSTSKYNAMAIMCCEDGRVRGIIQHYGANRTGRAAGRGVQPQNMKKTVSNADTRKKAPHLIDDALVIGKRAINLGVAGLLYDDVPGIISKLVRTSFIAALGKSLVVSDFSAIEGRVLPWIAGEEWVLDVFRTHGKIYEANAANMFNVPIESITKGSDLRAKGKVATLALGYQGWSGALITMGALREGLTEEELPGIAKAWRKANPRIVKLWGRLEDVAKHVIKRKTRYVLKGPYCDLIFSYEKGYMFIELPSGRRLAYYGAHLGSDGSIRYYGLDQVKKVWRREETYGGKLAENITQAIARDILYDAMYRMKDIDILEILLHIHDEIVAEADDDKATEALDIMNGIMSVGPDWTKGLPLKGDGYISKYYKKD